MVLSELLNVRDEHTNNDGQAGLVTEGDLLVLDVVADRNVEHEHEEDDKGAD